MFVIDFFLNNYTCDIIELSYELFLAGLLLRGLAGYLYDYLGDSCIDWLFADPLENLVLFYYSQILTLAGQGD